MLLSPSQSNPVLVTRNSPISHNVFYPVGKLSAILIKFKLPSTNSLSLEEPNICRLGKCYQTCTGYESMCDNLQLNFHFGFDIR